MDTSIRDLCEDLGKMLVARGESLATAESCTGGLLGSWLTSIPGSSEWYLGGVVAYANRIKEDILGVPTGVINKEGAVSRPCVKAMCVGLESRFQAHLEVAISGIAGPGGGSPSKPVGTVWIGWRHQGRGSERMTVFPGNREAVRQAAARAALQGLVDVLKSAGNSPRG
ncbi:MAG: CinA family protein [Deltaproteobacteria bacterium]|nr:CinA family protein [Deltaproteobacteria bacterium]